MTETELSPARAGPTFVLQGISQVVKKIQDTLPASSVVKYEGGGSISRLLVLYFICLLELTLSPFTFSIDPLRSLSADLSGPFPTTAWDIFTNFLLFLPFGFLLVALPTVSRRRFARKIILVAASAFVISLAVESCQLFLPRDPSMVDVFVNTVGGVAGALIAIHYYNPISRVASRVAHRCWLDVQRARSIPLILTCYAIIVLVVSSLPVPLSADFSNWEPDLPFQLGNEASLDRPWIGKISLVAIHGRCL